VLNEINFEEYPAFPELRAWDFARPGLGCQRRGVQLQKPGGFGKGKAGHGEFRQLALSGRTPKFDAALEQFSVCYRANLFERSVLYPEVAETLDYLRAGQIRLACITNKREAFADALLIKAGIRERFDVLLGGDSLAERKPSPMPLLRAAQDLGIAPTDAGLLGDSRHDYHAAESAGFSFIWAGYGYGLESDFSDCGDMKRIQRFGELCALV
jgi:phosphoglycolate phosphatase